MHANSTRPRCVRSGARVGIAWSSGPRSLGGQDPRDRANPKGEFPGPAVHIAAATRLPTIPGLQGGPQEAIPTSAPWSRLTAPHRPPAGVVAVPRWPAAGQPPGVGQQQSRPSLAKSPCVGPAPVDALPPLPPAYAARSHRRRARPPPPTPVSGGSGDSTPTSTAVPLLLVL